VNVTLLGVAGSGARAEAPGWCRTRVRATPNESNP